MDQTQAIADFLRMLRRRAAILVLVSALGIAASVGFAIMQPPVYETSAKILVESQQISTDLARSTVNMSAAERLQLIEQRLTSRNYLISIIEDFSLFSDAEALTINDKIDLLRAAIRVESILVSGQEQSGDTEIFAFTITMRHEDAEQAAEIVNTFVETAVAENLRVRAERARDTRAYFQEQVARAADQIVLIEGEISAFKLENEGALPEGLEYRRDELVRLQESVMEIDRSLLELGEERLTMELALAGGTPVHTGELTPQSPEEAELRRLAIELAQKRRLLAPDNPELLRLQERISAIAELVPSMAVADALAVVGPDGRSPEQENGMLRQLALLEDQIELLNQQKATIDERRATLERSIQATPQVGVALNSLERRLGELQDQHSALVQRYAEARTGEELETNEQSERFRVVEDALAPDEPVEPSRKKIVALGSGGSVGLAIALVLLIEMFQPALRTSSQMERRLGIRPVISIPLVRTPWERRRRQIAWAAALILVAVGVGLAMPYATKEGSPLRPLAAKLGVEGLLGDPATSTATASVPTNVGTDNPAVANDEPVPMPGAASEEVADGFLPDPAAVAPTRSGAGTPPLLIPPAERPEAEVPLLAESEEAADAATTEGTGTLPLLMDRWPEVQLPNLSVKLLAAASSAAGERELRPSQAAYAPGGTEATSDAAHSKTAVVGADRSAEAAATSEVARGEPQPLPVRSTGPEEAGKLFDQAVDLGPRDPGRTRDLYARAAALGHVRAAYYLGQIYETGDGVTPDPTLAQAWYEVASAASGMAAEPPGDPSNGAVEVLPDPLLAARQEDGTVDLVWSPTGGQTRFVVEFAEAPDAAPRFRGEVAGHTLSVALPAEVEYWRVAPLRDGAAAPATWQKLGS